MNIIVDKEEKKRQKEEYEKDPKKYILGVDDSVIMGLYKTEYLQIGDFHTKVRLEHKDPNDSICKKSGEDST